MSVMRWKFYKDAFSRDCSCDIEECKTGDYILFSDHQSYLAEREQRIAALRTALKYEVDNCVNCDGEGRYKVMYPEYETGWTECQRCKPARAALAATEGEKREYP